MSFAIKLNFVAKKVIMISIDQGELEQIVFSAISRALKLNKVAFLQEEKIIPLSDQARIKGSKETTNKKEAQHA